MPNVLKIGEVLFSGGTYQVQIVDEKGEEYWPLLQYTHQGGLQDQICSCDAKKCPHVEQARILIEGPLGIPLHRRWFTSFWYALAVQLAEHYGYEPPRFEDEGGRFLLSIDRNKVAEVSASAEDANLWLHRMLVERPKETEENSLKFSNRSPEEIAHWKAGHPGQDLRLELSPWSDLCKMAFIDQNREELESMTWEKSTKELPKSLHTTLARWSWKQEIPSEAWPSLIPTLHSVPSALQELTRDQELMSLRFDPQVPRFRIEKHQSEEDVATHGSSIRVGDWAFLPGQGFLRVVLPNLHKLEAESKESIARVLDRHSDEVQHLLKGTPLHLTPVRPLVHLHFDAAWNLIVEVDLHERGDLQRPGVQIFGPWVYLPEGHDAGFWRLEGLPFDSVFTKVPASQMDDFVARNKAFFNGFKGFHTHLTPLETQIGYKVADDSLKFMNLLEQRHTVGSHDFGEWVYLEHQGFYAKVSGPLSPTLRTGTVVPAKEITSFIRAHREDLLSIQGFFAPINPILNVGLRIVTQGDKILITPEVQYREGIDPKRVTLYGDFAYVEGEGFFELPPSQRIPEGYDERKQIDAEHVPWFVGQVLDTLRPFALTIDPKLVWAQNLQWVLSSMDEEEGRYQLDMELHTSEGSVSLSEIFEGIRAQKGMLISSGGLLNLNGNEFKWIRNLSKGQIDSQGKHLQLTLLELMRFTLMGVWDFAHQPPSIRTQLEAALSTSTDHVPPLTGFKSQLRPYQQIGVHWLWSLYSHRLSALLCDDMGLGKTHQAMALLAAVAGVSEQKKLNYLVVCPTSVIYHWEDQLRRFLPEFHVTTFHGSGRSLQEFKKRGGVLLTSYGILRTSKSPLEGVPFEVAIFDEIQYAKNASSHTHKALSAIQARMVVGLTGTPIENNLKELKALFDIVVPGYMPSEAAFREWFLNPIEKYNDQAKRELLSRCIHPFVLRRRKVEVLQDLPEKIEEIAVCDLSEEQKRLYQDALTKGKQEMMPQLMDQEHPVPYIHVFALLGHLKQICDHPALVIKTATSYKHHHSGKWDLFCELLSEALQSGQKVVIFSHYLKMLDLIQEYLKDQNILFASVRGSTIHRQEELQRFKEAPTCQVFVGSLGAVGVGVDLSAASVVIHYDRWWNAAREDQATDRVHRMGQKRGVQVFKLVTRGTVEEKIHQMIQRKANLMQDVIKGEDQEILKRFNREEILELLQLLESSEKEGSGP